MALPDVTFTNNLGTFTLERCMVGISRNQQWSAGVVTTTRTISVSGNLARGDTLTTWEDILNDDSLREKGEAGTLILPWTTLTNIKIQSLSMPDDPWLEMLPYTIEFLDDKPDSANVYTLTWWGIEIHNPRLSIKIPTKPTKDEFAETILVGDPFSNSDPHNLPVRMRENFEVQDIELSGGIKVDDGVLPTNLFNILQQRAGKPGVTTAGSTSAPNGFPAVFALGTAIPELVQNLVLEKVWVSKASAVWNVEAGFVQCRIGMRCQPQEIIV